MQRTARFIVLCLLFLTACNIQDIGAGTAFQPPTETPDVVLTQLAAQPGSTLPAFATVNGVTPNIPTVSPQSTSTPPSNSPLLFISSSVPDILRQAALTWKIPLTDAPELATLQLVAQSTDSHPVAAQSTWIYALAAPFPTITDEVTFADLYSTWAGKPAGEFVGRILIMDEPTFRAMIAIMGQPGTGTVQVVAADQLLSTAWKMQNAWAIIPFESIEPRWKVLLMDGQSPLRRGFDPSSYPLRVNFVLQVIEGETPSVALIPFNRDASKLTTLIMTGVTALVRAIANRMEQKGVLYPEQDIGDYLRSADITHISNEVPFAQGCPPPNPDQTTLVFCSDPKYIALLEDVSTDVVELTGNHFQDWGTTATLFTIDMYKKRGWQYYGGGTNLEDSQRVAKIEHNGNKLAFIGCNPVGPDYEWATPDQPGAAACGDYQWMIDQIHVLRAEGYLPIATLQYQEYYVPFAPENQVRDFRRLADAGAIIVSGSQSHFPQMMEFYNGTFIHYGLGNLFFDQMDIPVVGTRRAFIDRHIFYDGRYIGTELITTMLEDYARQRLMTPTERINLLTEIFSYTKWDLIFP
jgi:capsule synthesis protein PGA_cap